MNKDRTGRKDSNVSAINENHMARQRRKQPLINSIKTIGATKWMALETIQYTDTEDKPQQWDMATRTTKKAGTPDAVVIIPLLRHMEKPSSTTETVVVEQFRIPVRSNTIEFPAGLIDANETAEEAAIRELKEETGYISCHAKAFGSRELCMTPGMVNETIKAVVVHVDLDDPRNKHPISEPDEGEIIIAKRVPLNAGLTAMMENGSNMPISMLYFFALGFELGNSLGSDDKAQIKEAPLGTTNTLHGQPQISELTLDSSTKILTGIPKDIKDRDGKSLV